MFAVIESYSLSLNYIQKNSSLERNKLVFSPAVSFSFSWGLERPKIALGYLILVCLDIFCYYGVLYVFLCVIRSIIA